jgi:hypothetical protein
MVQPQAQPEPPPARDPWPQRLDDVAAYAAALGYSEK